MKDDILVMISNKKEKDARGVYKEILDKRLVLCRVDSVSMTEFYSGAKAGLKPERRFIVFAGDYNGEKEVEYHGNRFVIYRTYERNLDEIELYAERKAGAV